MTGNADYRTNLNAVRLLGDPGDVVQVDHDCVMCDPSEDKEDLPGVIVVELSLAS